MSELEILEVRIKQELQNHKKHQNDGVYILGVIGGLESALHFIEAVKKENGSAEAKPNPSPSRINKKELFRILRDYEAKVKEPEQVIPFVNSYWSKMYRINGGLK